MVFIDFKETFDSLHRGLLMKILKVYGVLGTIVELIAGMYTGTTAKVVTADDITEAFDILAYCRETLLPHTCSSLLMIISCL